MGEVGNILLMCTLFGNFNQTGYAVQNGAIPNGTFIS